MTDKKTLFNSAGIGGLVLGGISIAYFLIGILISEAGAGTGLALLSGLLWIAKFAGCIMLMKFFMKKYSAAEPDADSSDVFRFGRLVALFSALLFAAFLLAFSTYINPSYFEDAILTAAQDNPMFNGEMMDMFEEMLPKLPTITFFSQFIYCWLFGTVVAAIFSRNIPSSNPFDNIDEQ